MAAVLEVAALVFKLNPNVLPPLCAFIHTSFSHAIRILCPDRLYEKTELAVYHAEEVNYTLLVDQGKTQAAKVNGLTKLDFLPAVDALGLKVSATTILSVVGKPLEYKAFSAPLSWLTSTVGSPCFAYAISHALANDPHLSYMAFC